MSIILLFYLGGRKNLLIDGQSVQLLCQQRVNENVHEFTSVDLVHDDIDFFNEPHVHFPYLSN